MKTEIKLDGLGNKGELCTLLMKNWEDGNPKHNGIQLSIGNTSILVSTSDLVKAISSLNKPSLKEPYSPFPIYGM